MVQTAENRIVYNPLVVGKNTFLCDGDRVTITLDSCGLPFKGSVLRMRDELVDVVNSTASRAGDTFPTLDWDGVSERRFALRPGLITSFTRSGWCILVTDRSVMMEHTSDDEKIARLQSIPHEVLFKTNPSLRFIVVPELMLFIRRPPMAKVDPTETPIGVPSDIGVPTDPVGGRYPVVIPEPSVDTTAPKQEVLDDDQVASVFEQHMVEEVALCNDNPRVLDGSFALTLHDSGNGRDMMLKATITCKRVTEDTARYGVQCLNTVTDTYESPMTIRFVDFWKDIVHARAQESAEYPPLYLVTVACVPGKADPSYLERALWHNAEVQALIANAFWQDDPCKRFGMIFSNPQHSIRVEKMGAAYYIGGERFASYDLDVDRLRELFFPSNQG